jgi:hypothetical protein
MRLKDKPAFRIAVGCIGGIMLFVSGMTALRYHVMHEDGSAECYKLAVASSPFADMRPLVLKIAEDKVINVGECNDLQAAVDKHNDQVAHEDALYSIYHPETVNAAASSS